MDYDIYNLGNVKLLSGKIILSAKLAYKTYGSLNSKRNNVIILPTFYFNGKCLITIIIFNFSGT